jgi:hypothetical protein
MEQDNKNNSSNSGCLIAVAIFVLANIAYYFFTTDKSNIAETGASFIFIVFLVAAYFGIKAYLRQTEGSDNKIARIVVPIGIVVVLMVLFGVMMKDFDSMVAIGSIGFIIFSIIIGILIYNSNKE